MSAPSVPPKLGFLHIPKSAGSSLNQSLYTAFGLEPTLVSEVLARGETPINPARAVVRGSMTFVLARNMPFLAGHSTFSDLKSLRREFVFTLLRDPRKRLISLFTYQVRRGRSRQIVRQRPAAAQFAAMDLRAFIAAKQPINTMAGLLLRDLPGYDEMVAKEDPHRAADLDAFIDEGLRRLDAVYACSNQEVLDDLHRRGVAPPAGEVTKNVTGGTFEFGAFASAREFLDLIASATWLDQRVYQRAALLFPETVRKPMAGDDEFMAELQRRFGLRLP